MLYIHFYKLKSPPHKNWKVKNLKKFVGEMRESQIVNSVGYTVANVSYSERTLPASKEGEKSCLAFVWRLNLNLKSGPSYCYICRVFLTIKEKFIGMEIEAR